MPSSYFSRVHRSWVVIVLILLCVIPEVVVTGADWGFWGSARWRPLMYQNGAFWIGLLLGWQPNYASQPYAMFVTYAFLHGGLGHLLMNMVTLISLSRALLQRVGQGKFLLIYCASILGGAIAYTFLGLVRYPMVGASGALFGLVGAWVVWDISDTMRVRPEFRTLVYAILWPIMILVLLNIAMYWATGGQLAWQTHLGGGIAGAAVALLLIWISPPKTPKPT